MNNPADRSYTIILKIKVMSMQCNKMSPYVEGTLQIIDLFLLSVHHCNGGYMNDGFILILYDKINNQMH